MLPALLPALVAVLGGVRPACGQDLDGWLVGLGGREGAIPRQQLSEWQRRLPDLPARLRRTAREGAGGARVGAARALGQVEEAESEETRRLLLELGEQAAEPSLRAACWSALAARGEQGALGGLLGRVIVAQEPLRGLALERLGLLDGPTGVRALTEVALAGSVPLIVRLQVVRRLGEVGAQAAAGRIRGLRLERDALGWREGRRLECAISVALLRLGEGDPEGALPLLIEAAFDPEQELAGEALSGLRLLPPAQVGGGLLGVLRDKDPARRLRALQIAGLVGAGSPELILRVEEIAIDEDEQLTLRQAAVRTLGRLGSLGSLPHLCGLLERRGRPEETPLRSEAAGAIARLGVGAAGRLEPGRLALERALRDEEALVRRAALRALTTLGDPRSAAALRDLLLGGLPTSSAERLLRVQAARRLGLDQPEVAERVLGLRREDDDARLALELIAYAREVPDLSLAAPALLDLLAHGSSLVREGAHAALLQRSGARIPYDPQLSPWDGINLERWRGWWEEARKR